jgi:hypothetical protein
MNTGITGTGDSRPCAADGVLRRIVVEIVDGLRHGYFEFRLTCEVIGGGRRRVLLHAGKTYQFVLDAASCTATDNPRDPQHADALDTD